MKNVMKPHFHVKKTPRETGNKPLISKFAITIKRRDNSRHCANTSQEKMRTSLLRHISSLILPSGHLPSAILSAVILPYRLLPSKLLLLAVLLACVPVSKTRAAVVSEDSCRHIVQRIKTLHYRNPADPELARTLLWSFGVLRDQNDKSYYLFACNKYVDWLFRHSDLQATKGFLKRICSVAETSNLDELKAVARRAQAQYMLRLGLVSLASSYVHEAMALCPSYRQAICPDTYLSIGSQVINILVEQNRADSAAVILSRVERGYRWHRAHGYDDPRNWMEVRLYGLHARVEMMRGNMAVCGRWMRRCREAMVPGTSMSYYATYYIMCYTLDTRARRYASALRTVDSLLAVGPVVRPLRSQYLLSRAELLNKLGRPQASADAYALYLEQSDRIDRLLTAERMEQLRAHYEYDKAVADRKSAEHDRLLMVFATVVMLALLCVVVWATVVLRRKNRHLVRLLRSRREQLPPAATAVGVLSSAAPSASVPSVTVPSGNPSCAPSEINAAQQDEPNAAQHDETDMALGAKAVAFLTGTRAYNDIDGGRTALAGHLGTSERTAVAAVAAYTGQSFKTFTNTLKLEESRLLLEGEPQFTITAIATQCGFGTLRTYQNLFKEKYGLSPSQYRASLQEE